MRTFFYERQLLGALNSAERVVFIQSGRFMGRHTFAESLFARLRRAAGPDAEGVRLIRGGPSSLADDRATLIQWLDRPEGIMVVERLDDLLDDKVIELLGRSGKMAEADARFYATIAKASVRWKELGESSNWGYCEWLKLVPWTLSPDWEVELGDEVREALGRAEPAMSDHERDELTGIILDAGQLHPALLASGVQWCLGPSLQYRWPSVKQKGEALRAAMTLSGEHVIGKCCEWLRAEVAAAQNLYAELEKSSTPDRWSLGPPRDVWRALVDLASGKSRRVSVGHWSEVALEISGLVVPTATRGEFVLPDVLLERGRDRRAEAASRLVREIVLRDAGAEAATAPAQPLALTLVETGPGKGVLRSADGTVAVEFHKQSLALLRALAASGGNAVQVKELRRQLGAENEAAVRAVIQRLQARIEAAGLGALIENVHSEGYRAVGVHLAELEGASRRGRT